MSDGCCGGDLDVAALQAEQQRVLKRVLAINATTFLMMISGAMVSGSSSLLSGSLDNLGDALTYAMSLAVVGAGVSTKARVAMVKGLLIFGAAIAVAVQIAWRLTDPRTPIFETMGVVALLNLVANAACLWLLSPHRTADVNMASVWECSRNDVVEGVAVIGAAVLVGLLESGWPDLLVATALLLLFLRSASRVLRNAWREMHPEPTA